MQCNLCRPPRQCLWRADDEAAMQLNTRIAGQGRRRQGSQNIFVHKEKDECYVDIEMGASIYIPPLVTGLV